MAGARVISISAVTRFAIAIGRLLATS